MYQPLAHNDNHDSAPHRLHKPTPRVLTVKEFHAAIGGAIGINSLYGFARSGRLKTVRVGRKRLVLAAELDDFFQREAEAN